MPSTTTSAATSTDTSSASGGSLLAAGGTTLILACLALGLFIGGLLIMFTMRRYLRGRRTATAQWERDIAAHPWMWNEQTAAWAPQPGLLIAMGLNSARHPPRGFGKKPELWDLHVAKSLGVQWQDLMPISAFKPFLAGECHPPPPSTSDTHTSSSTYAPYTLHLSSSALHPFRVGLQDTAQAFHALRSPHASPHPPSVDTHPTTSNVSSTSTTESVELGVAIAITLPSNSSSRIPPFVLGIADVEWKG
ncbi:uncharacterized protein BXZ73DRAFT_80951 [Epithele typhae]|uniref:uncharacterized protein n=1 Tax=Epithele typhae TaxID=378194 RepID=UPI0020072BDB|nr:uncharacterized protein BXZ73DRAFT_80951 [Epithele typhae]KAH9916985.1 hypothetical protein BXZ73DRAFT_80951 [Epithele typhae]